MSDFQGLPQGLPEPVDDGAAAHLEGMMLADVDLLSTAGRRVNPATLAGRVVIYCYPMTGRPGVALPEGWDAIPGARGCTPQSCSFRDHHGEIAQLGARVFGLSTQGRDYQREMAGRLHLPFEVLSDEGLQFSTAMNLPMFEVEGMTLLRRLTMIAHEGMIEAVHYPVFPSDSDPAWVIARLAQLQGP